MKKTLYKILGIFLVLGIALYWIPSPREDFFERYPHKDEPARQLKAFLERPVKTLRVNNVTWEYYMGGKGPATILFIHGMGGAYDLWWQQVFAFENRYRVITYTLPEDINSLKGATEGILAILKNEGVDSVIVVGTSMGGYIAQYLVDRYPEKIERAVFGNTFPPNKRIAEKNAKTARILRFVPEIVIQKVGSRQFATEILPAAHNSPLLAAFLPSLPFSKKQFMNRYAVVVDPFYPRPFRYAVKRIPKLIIESDNDPLIEPELRMQLKQFYPDAQVFTFHGEGHFPYINAASTYNSVLDSFFSQKNEWRAIERTIGQYFRGRKQADEGLLKQVFHEQARLYTVQNGKIVEIPLARYLQKVREDGPVTVRTTILDGNVSGKQAVFTTQFEYPNGTTYQDELTLLKTKAGWRIVVKTFREVSDSR